MQDPDTAQTDSAPQALSLVSQMRSETGKRSAPRKTSPSPAHEPHDPPLGSQQRDEQARGATLAV